MCCQVFKFHSPQRTGAERSYRSDSTLVDLSGGRGGVPDSSAYEYHVCFEGRAALEAWRGEKERRGKPCVLRLAPRDGRRRALSLFTSAPLSAPLSSSRALPFRSRLCALNWIWARHTGTCARHSLIINTRTVITRAVRQSLSREVCVRVSEFVLCEFCVCVCERERERD